METAEKMKNEKIIYDSEMNNNNQKNIQEEIIAQHNDEVNIKNSFDKSANSKSFLKIKQSEIEATYSNIVFDKHELFFYSLPNKMAFDSVVIKNTGKTCIYFKWQKNNKSYQLEDKKNDGIDRFYCHYTDSKIFPDEERKKKMGYSVKNGF